MTSRDPRSSARPDRLDEIDLLRGIAISAVVALHVSWRMLTPESLAHAGGTAVAAIHLASGFGVPLFVALSVFGLLRRHGQAFRSAREYGGFLAQRARRLLPAYLFWSLASIAAGDAWRLADPVDVARMLLGGSADIQFYFVPMIFELYVLWPLMRPLLVRAGDAAGAAMLSAIALLVTLSAWGGAARPSVTELAMFAPWIAAGAIAHAIEARARTQAGSVSVGGGWIAIAASMLAAASLLLALSRLFVETSAATSRDTLLIATMIFRWPQALTAAALLTALACLAAPLRRSTVGPALVALGRASYGIFLVHLLVASSVVWRFFDFDAAMRAGPSAAVFDFILAWGVTLAVSCALSLALGRSARTSWTVGAR